MARGPSVLASALGGAARSVLGPFQSLFIPVPQVRSSIPKSLPHAEGFQLLIFRPDLSSILVTRIQLPCDLHNCQVLNVSASTMSALRSQLTLFLLKLLASPSHQEEASLAHRLPSQDAQASSLSPPIPSPSGP